MLQRPFGIYSPWREMERLRREMDRIFDQSVRSLYTAPAYPAMNVWTNEDGAIVTAELPGVAPEDIDISVMNDTVTLTGCHNPEQVDGDVSYHRRERSCGRFSRSFQLPFQIDPEGVEAVYENGVLKVTLPRVEEDKPKRITVKAG